MASISKLEFFLINLKPVTVLTAQVNGAPSDPYMGIAYDGGNTGTATSVGTSGAPVPGNTVWFGTTSGGQERGTVRLRSWTPSGATGTTGNLSIAETDDVGPNIADDDYITVKLEWRLWNITPRLVQRGTEVEFYEDYDVGFTDQTTNWRPIAVAGPPAVEFGRGPVQASFVGNRSFALASGATITTYLWTAHGSVEGTSSSQGTEASPVVFTWNSAGQYLVTLQVTDSNGNTHTAYTWAFIIDPSDISAGVGAYTQFDAYNDSHDFTRGGGECSFTVHGTADVSQFPRESMVVHAARGTQTTATGTWPFRSNVLGVYYVVGNSIRQDSIHNTTSFRAVTIDGLMKNLSMHATSLRDERGPSNWTMASDITVDRAASFQMLWRSTLADMTPIVRLNYSAEIKRQDFAPTNLYAQLQNELVKDAWAQVVSSHQSVLYLARNYNLMTLSERTTASTRKLLHKGIWLDTLDVEERQDYEWPTRKVKMSGIHYPGNQAEPVPLFSEAPGDVHKSFGREDAPGRLILSTQADLNTRCGYALARQNYRWHTVRGRFVNDGSFTVAPQEIFPANIESTDNNRGLSWQPDLIPRRLHRTYDHQGGYYVSEVEFEPSVTGPDGVTVTLPSGTKPPRTPTLPEYDVPPLPPWTPPITPLAGAAGAADKVLGTYWTDDKGATWQRRVNGLAIGATTGTNQLLFNDLIWDPWWFTESKHATSDPEQSIWWGCGPGFVVKSDDAMKNWEDLTPYITSPATGTVSIDGVNFLQLHADIHNIDTFYALAEWGTGSAWNSSVGKTTDNGKTWVWHDLANVIMDDDGFIYPVLSKGLYGYAVGTDASLVVESGQGQASGEADESFLELKYYEDNPQTLHPPDHRCNVIFDFGATISTQVTIWVKGYKVDTIGDFFGNKLYTNSAAEWSNAYDGFQTGGWLAFGAPVFDTGWLSSAPTADAWYKVLTTNAGAPESFRYFALQTTVRAPGTWDDGARWLCDTIRIEGGSATQNNYRPLAMDLDSEDSSRLYITMWNQSDSTIELWTMNTSSFGRLATVVVGDAATNADITTRTEWAFPHTPHYPGTANFGDYVYVAGRWSYTGTVNHLYRSTDTGVTLSNIGDASWTTERVGGFRPDESLAGATLYAFLNNTPAMWRTQDAGVSWANLGSDPFDVEFEAVSIHWGGGGDFLIANNAAGVVQAAWLDSPYTDAWYDATGPAGQRLPTAADGGGGICAIAWV